MFFIPYETYFSMIWKLRLHHFKITTIPKAIRNFPNNKLYSIHFILNILCVNHTESHYHS